MSTVAQKSKEFDYETKIWGNTRVRTSPIYIQGLKLKRTLKALENVTGKLIDIGCGAGNMAKAIKYYRPDLDVFGFDMSKAAIKYANNNPESVSFFAGSAEKLPWNDRSFDGAVMFDVLEHTKNPDRVVSETSRILKKGGIFHIFCPLEADLTNIYGWLWKAGWKAKKIHCGHIQQFTLKSLERLLENNRFKVEDKSYSFHPLFSLIDVTYFSLLYLRGKRPTFSVEGSIDEIQATMARKLLELGKNSVSLLGYLESNLLKNIPGGGVHITCQKI